MGAEISTERPDHDDGWNVAHANDVSPLGRLDPFSEAAPSPGATQIMTLASLGHETRTAAPSTKRQLELPVKHHALPERYCIGLRGGAVPPSPVHEKTKWALPHYNTLVPAASPQQMLRGAKEVDSTLRQRDNPSSNLDKTSMTPEELEANLWPSRSGLESENVSLCASVGAAQFLQESLTKKVKSLKEILTRGDVDGFALDTDEVLASAHQTLQSQRMQAVALDAELDRCRDKIRAHISVSERQRHEMTTLKRDFFLQSRKASSAREECGEAQEKLQEGRKACEKLVSDAKNEQVRVAMLREAFDQEQSRMGTSLERAETFVSDLITATQGTRRVELEEQALARECVEALTEIHAAERQDALSTEAQTLLLKRELDSAERAFTDAQGRSEHFAFTASSQLSEARKKLNNVSLIANRCVANESALRKHTEIMSGQCNTLAKELKQVQQTHQQGLPPEEAAMAELHHAESRMSSLIAEAQEMTLGKRWNSPGVFPALQCIKAFSEELDVVRAGLCERAKVIVRQDSAVSENPDWRLDLEAAGLQRRLGKALAAEHERCCVLLEAHGLSDNHTHRVPVIPYRVRCASDPQDLRGSVKC